MNIMPPAPCLLCGCRATVWGVFSTKGRAFGTPAGKTRSIHYGLCGGCMGDGNTPSAGQIERIEKVILFELTTAGVVTRGER